MAEINLIEFIPDPDHTKKDLIKIHLTFSKDEIYNPYVLDINHKQGHGKTLVNEFNHGLFLIQATLPLQLFEYSLKNKISKIGKGHETVYFVARIFTLSGRAHSKKYSLDDEVNSENWP